MIQFKKILISSFLISACMGCTTQNINTPFVSSPACEIIILASPQDPYYPLAEEIATSEDAPLAQLFIRGVGVSPYLSLVGGFTQFTLR
jgi:hypothetical protein